MHKIFKVGVARDRDKSNVARDRLLSENVILVHSKFKDPGYVRAVEDFFGSVGDTSTPSSV